MVSSIYEFSIYFLNFISTKSRKQFCFLDFHLGTMFHLGTLFEKTPKQTFSCYKVSPCMKMVEASFRDLHPHPNLKKNRKTPNFLHSLSLGIYSCSGMTGVHCSHSYRTTLALPKREEAHSLLLPKIMPSIFSFKDLLKFLFISYLAINKNFHSSKPQFFTILKSTEKLFLLSSFLECCTPQQTFTANEISLKFNAHIK